MTRSNRPSAHESLIGIACLDCIQERIRETRGRRPPSQEAASPKRDGRTTRSGSGRILALLSVAALLLLTSCAPTVDEERKKETRIFDQAKKFGNYPVVHCTRWREFRYAWMSGYVSGPGMQYECIEWESPEGSR